MASLDVAWCALEEPSSGDTFVVSPDRGSLYVFPSGDWQRLAAADLEAIGCRPHERVAGLPDVVNAADRIPDYVERPWVWRAGARSRLASWAVRAHVLGLRRSLEAVRPDRTRRSIEGILRDIKSAEGRVHADACLPRALARWAAFVRAGFDPKLVLGVAVPAARLHAWVTLDGAHIGEDADEVVQYRPAVSYGLARAR